MPNKQLDLITVNSTITRNNNPNNSKIASIPLLLQGCWVSFPFGWRIDSWSLCTHLDTTYQGSIIRVGLGTAKLVARL